MALQAKDGNVVKRLQIHGWDNNVSYFRSDDGGITWPEGVALLKASDLAVKSIGATTAPPSDKKFWPNGSMQLLWKMDLISG